jgi:hypothetical protein
MDTTVIDWSKATWVKSPDSAMKNCVQVARVGDVIGVRDSKLGDASPVLSFNQAEIDAFRSGILSGALDDVLSAS